MNQAPDETQEILSTGDENRRHLLLAEAFMRHRVRLRKMLELRMDSRLQQRPLED